MRTRTHSLAVVAILLLAACTPKEEVPYDPGLRVEVPEKNLGFRFHEELTMHASSGEALLIGNTTSMQVQTLSYGEAVKPAKGEEVPSWAIPWKIARNVEDERSCGPLKSASVVLPIDTSSPVRCDIVIDRSGRAVVWMVGLGRPFQDVTFLQSSFIVFEGDRYHLFWYVYPFPEGDATVQWLAETFDSRHPHMSPLIWPNKSFGIHIREVRETLSKQIEPPSEEVQGMMERLRELAFSVAPVTPTQDR